MHLRRPSARLDDVISPWLMIFVITDTRGLSRSAVVSFRSLRFDRVACFDRPGTTGDIERLFRLFLKPFIPCSPQTMRAGRKSEAALCPRSSERVTDDTRFTAGTAIPTPLTVSCSSSRSVVGAHSTEQRADEGDDKTFSTTISRRSSYQRVASQRPLR